MDKAEFTILSSTLEKPVCVSEEPSKVFFLITLLRLIEAAGNN